MQEEGERGGTTDEEALAQTVACDECGAEPLNPCFTVDPPGGNTLVGVPAHLGRIRAARQRFEYPEPDLGGVHL